MYCIKCGVQLADAEKSCPLCNTVVYHPQIPVADGQELYPIKKVPKSASGRAFFGGAVIILFMIPLIITFLSDFHTDGRLDWFGFAAGGILLAYLTFFLPTWFKKPNPVIFIPCDFAACAVYLLYIELATGGGWFLSLAFPLVLGAAVITCTLITLLRYLRRGRLYVVGGTVMALGAFVVMIEGFVDLTLQKPFIGWSFYPLIPLALVGGLLIYLAMNATAREKIERKLFF